MQFPNHWDPHFSPKQTFLFVEPTSKFYGKIDCKIRMVTTRNNFFCQTQNHWTRTPSIEMIATNKADLQRMLLLKLCHATIIVTVQRQRPKAKDMKRLSRPEADWHSTHVDSKVEIIAYSTIYTPSQESVLGVASEVRTNCCRRRLSLYIPRAVLIANCICVSVT